MKGYIYAAAALAAIGALGWSHLSAYRAGRAAEQAAFIQQINRENTDAGNKAEDWRAEFRRCTDAGGVYDFEAGTCDR